MTISYQQALSWLSENPDATVAEIRNLVSQVSAEVPDAKVTILYSGKVGDIDAWKIAEGMGADVESVATIGKTDVAVLLNNSSFRASLQSAAVREGLEFTEIIDGKSPDGLRITNDSLWDVASHNFVSNISGEVITITPNADAGSVFSQTEVIALLEDSGATRINGVDFAEVSDVYTSQGLSAVQSKINQASSAISSDSSAWKTLIGELSDSGILSKSTLSKLGVAGDILALSVAASEAKAAEDAGDLVKSHDIMEDWAAEFLGGVAGGVAAVAVVVPLIPVVTSSAIIAGTIAIAAGITGGIYGGEVGKYLLDKAKELGLYDSDAAGDFQEAAKDLLNDFLDDAQTISDFLQDALNDLLQSQVFVAPARRDPLSLDLDGDGLELVNVNESTAFFDLDVVDNGDGTYTSDGFKEQVGWVKGDDGILVLDKNNNGAIDNILELFGKENKTGTEELREYDLNGDGKINSQDSIFNQLKVWQDVNQDGVSQSEELKTLSQLGIASINLNNLTTKNEVKEGNLIISQGTYTKSNGSTGTYSNLDLNGDGIEQISEISYADSRELVNLSNSTAICELDAYGFRDNCKLSLITNSI